MKGKETILSFILIMGCLFFTSAQDKDKALQQSNELIYEANELASSDFIEAEKEYRKAISKKPENTVGSYNLAHTYIEEGHIDEALYRNLQTTLKSNSKKERHHAFHNIGNILMEKEECKDAVEAYKNALRNDPTDEETRYNLALAKECAKNQGGGDGEDENSDDKNEDENKQSENENNEDQKDQGDNPEDQDSEGEDEQENEGEDKQDENGKPSDEKDDKEDNQPGDKKQQQQQPQQGKLSPQQVRNLLEAMNNQEKKVQEKINAQKVKGTKVRTDKDW